MGFVYRRVGRRAVLNHDSEKEPLSGKDKMNPDLGGVCVSIHRDGSAVFLELEFTSLENSTCMPKPCTVINKVRED